jgi:hypothetical protein
LVRLRGNKPKVGQIQENYTGIDSETLIYSQVMKNISISVLGLAAVVAVSWGVSGFRAEAQTPVSTAAGTPPLGRQVVIQMVAWPISTAVANNVEGTLIAMTDQWIIVKGGSDENWVPREKVMLMKASK